MIVKSRLLTDWSLFQFNFKFNLSEDMYAEDSVELLQVLIKSQLVGKMIVMSWFVQNSGIQFERHEREGIETVHFAEILLVSGIVLLDNVKWLSFHSGYDFGYLLRYLSQSKVCFENACAFRVLIIWPFSACWPMWTYLRGRQSSLTPSVCISQTYTTSNI